MRNLRWEVWDVPRYGAHVEASASSTWPLALWGTRIEPMGQILRGVVSALNGWALTP